MKYLLLAVLLFCGCGYSDEDKALIANTSLNRFKELIGKREAELFINEGIPCNRILHAANARTYIYTYELDKRGFMRSEYPSYQIQVFVLNDTIRGIH